MKILTLKKFFAVLLLMLISFSWMACDAGGDEEDNPYPYSYIIVSNLDSDDTINGVAWRVSGTSTWNEELNPDTLVDGEYYFLYSPDEVTVDIRVSSISLGYQYLNNQTISLGKVLVVELDDTFGYAIVNAQVAEDAGYDLSISKEKSQSITDDKFFKVSEKREIQK